MWKPIEKLLDTFFRRRAASSQVDKVGELPPHSFFGDRRYISYYDFACAVVQAMKEAGAEIDTTTEIANKVLRAAKEDALTIFYSRGCAKDPINAHLPLAHMFIALESIVDDARDRPWVMASDDRGSVASDAGVSFVEALSLDPHFKGHYATVMGVIDNLKKDNPRVFTLHQVETGEAEQIILQRPNGMIPKAAKRQPPFQF